MAISIAALAVVAWMVPAVFAGTAAKGGVQVAQSQLAEPALSQLTNVKSEKNDKGVSVTLESTGSLQYTAFKLQNPLRLVMDFPKTRQGVLSKALPVTVGTVDSIRPIYFDDAEVLRVEFVLKNASNYEIVRQGPNALVVNFSPVPAREVSAQAKEAPAPVRESMTPSKPPVAAEAVLAGQEGKSPAAATSKEESFGVKEALYSEDFCHKILGGEKERLSLDFQGAQLANIFRILSDVGGFNLVLHPEVKGETNIRLVNVPWNQALELILKNNNLTKQCFANIVRIAPMNTLASEEKARADVKRSKKTADQEEEMAGDLETEVIPINYANIKDLGKNLKDMMTKRGRVVIDERTNTVVLTDIRKNLDLVAGVVRNLDRPVRAISIQARIVETTRNAAKTLGIQWGGQFTGTTNHNFPQNITAGPNITSSTPGRNFIIDLPNAAQLATGNVGGVGMTLGSLTKDILLDVQLAALEQQGQGRTLSNPRVTTLDNKEAKIQSGRKIPYATVSQDGTRIQFVDATIELNVTPHVTRDDDILMRIQAKKNAADFNRQSNGVPTITTKEAFTEVVVNNAETTVLGGLYQSDVQNAQNKIPFFADIPLLGYLFKNFNDTLQVDELLIFITPTIVQQ